MFTESTTTVEKKKRKPRVKQYTLTDLQTIAAQLGCTLSVSIVPLGGVQGVAVDFLTEIPALPAV
jgi:hypothetical protein